MKIFLLSILIFSITSISPGCNGHDTKNNRYTYSDSDTTGEVIKIIDGDTYDLLTPDKKTIRIRMSGIDAPEKGQPFYQKAKDFLGQLCFRKNVTIEKINIDQYGRLVASSYTEDGTSLSYEMVKNGFAWHFTKYDSDSKLEELEKQARESNSGLWADPNPMPPWELRAHRRSGKKDNEE